LSFASVIFWRLKDGEVLNTGKIKLYIVKQMIEKKKIVCVLFVAILLSVMTEQAITQSTEKEELAFEIEVCSTAEAQAKSGELIALELEKIGIDLTLKSVALAPLYADIFDARNFDFFVMAQYVLPFPSDIIWFDSAMDVTPGTTVSNHWGFHNDTMDSLLAELRALPSANKTGARDLMREIQVVWAQNLPVIFLYAQNPVHYARKEWTGYVYSPVGIYSAYNPWTMINITSTVTPGTGHFRMSVVSDYSTTNPFVAMDHRSLFIKPLLYDTLVKFSPDFQEIVPYLADSWNVSSDGLTYAFHIRENAVWHDGQPLTSEDVAFTFGRIKNDTIPRYYQDVKNIESIETPDEHTVVLHLNQTYFWFLSALFDIPIVPKHIWESQKWDWTNPAPVGSGPFKWGTHVAGEYLELSKNAEWWMVGYPKIDTWSWQIIPNEDARLLSARNGETDADRYAPWAAGPIPAILAAPELNAVQSPGENYQYLGINMRRPPLDDVRIRRAIAYAINRTEIVEKGFLGYGTPVYSCIAAPFYDYWYNPAIEHIVPMTTNIDMANQILDEAGYIDVDNDGIREMPGAVAPTPQNWMLYAAIGVSVAVVAVVTSVFLLRRRKKK
jgi:ABC-type transport system substrate-binding protein